MIAVREVSFFNRRCLANGRASTTVQISSSSIAELANLKVVF